MNNEFKTLSEALASKLCPTKEKIRREHQAKIDMMDNVYSLNHFRNKKKTATA